MNTRDKQRLKRQLNEWHDDLLRQAGQSVSVLKDSGTQRADLIDQAVEESSRSFFLRIRDRETLLMHKIRQSLRDIDEGTYGICQSCGESISAARMRVRPVARHCIECKTAMERSERLISLRPAG